MAFIFIFLLLKFCKKQQRNRRLTLFARNVQIVYCITLIRAYICINISIIIISIIIN